MKVMIKGSVGGEVRYEDEADLGDGPLALGTASGPIAEAMGRIRRRYDVDYPFNPFDKGASISDGWPALTYSFHSEYE